MIKQKKGQLSFAQPQVNSCLDETHWLQKIGDLIDWKPIRQKFSNLHPSNTGRPAYDPVFMFKILLPEQWFKLSDPQAEVQINDRISFKIFLGMDIIDTGPDETTICNFRNYIGSLDLAEELFEEINRQFEQKGVIVKTGTLVDASFYQAST
jgi:IS5 family transposase